MGAPLIVLVLTFVFLCLALAGNLAGLIGQSWYKDGTNESGLLRFCDSNNECEFYKDLFETTEYFIDRFIVIILLIAACGFLFLGLLSSLTMCCCQKSRGVWTCGAVFTSALTFLGAGASLAALIYYEIKQGDDKFKVYTRGWSNITCWVGAGIGALAYLFTDVMMCCVKPKKYSGGSVNVVLHPSNPPTAPAPINNYPMVSHGYNHGF